jgi:hypothetical protein
MTFESSGADVYLLEGQTLVSVIFEAQVSEPYDDERPADDELNDIG